VIGGGPAGIAAGIAARQKGFAAVVADGGEPPIDKPCGEGLTPGTRAALQALGVKLKDGEGYRFRGIRFVQRDASVCADFPEGPGIGLRRPLLHQKLIAEAERCGVRLLWKTPVAGIDSNGVQMPGAAIAARWIIGADGSRSRVRHWSGLEATEHRRNRSAVRRHYRVRPWTDYAEIHWGARAQAYVTPVESEEVCVVLLAERAEDIDFDEALKGMPELQARLANAELSSRERGAITSMYSLRKVQQGNIALIGDASMGIDAITGEGLRLAFRQASALTAAMECDDLERYQQAHRELALRPMGMGKLLLWLGRNPGLRERVLHTLARDPELFARLLAIHAGRAKRSHMITTGALLGWRIAVA
jgi:menaquinone-9 beta-reductase